MLVKENIAGILTEISTDMDPADYIDIGLGLNVNICFQRFSEQIKEKATSLLIETRNVFSRNEVVQAYLEWYEKYYDLFKNKYLNKSWKDGTNLLIS